MLWGDATELGGAVTSHSDGFLVGGMRVLSAPRGDGIASSPSRTALETAELIRPLRRPRKSSPTRANAVAQYVN